LGVGPNLRLLVGRDIRELDQIFRLLRDTLSLGLGALLTLALAGGLLMSLSAQRRVTQFNRTIAQVMSGDFSQRIPISGGQDEYRELAQKINEMLAQIEALIGSIRHVGDNVAHDLRGPLTRLRNRLELLAAEENPDAARIAECIEQADGLLDVFNALLRIARIESGAYQSAFATFDLTRVVHDVCSLFRAAAEERNLSFRSDLADNLRLTGDRELIAQAVSNLLDNAIKYTPAGGKLEVTLATVAGSSAEILIADSGPGIPIAEHDKVLDRFYRLDHARSQPGSGLGLALVKAVVDQHGGKLRIGDNRPGLRVTLELPLEREH
jgi:signal transduction histidine kinase